MYFCAASRLIATIFNDWRGKSGQHRAPHFLTGSLSEMRGESAAENKPPEDATH